MVNGTKNLRFDPEYFNRDAIFAQSQLKSAPPLSDFIEDGYRVVYETTEAIDKEVGLRDNLPFFLQSADISTPYINTDSMIYVSQSDWDRYEKGRVKPGELLIEVKGKAEKIAIVPENFPVKTLVTGTLYKLSIKEDDQKYVIASFLLGRYGQALKNRLKTNLLVSYIAKDDLYSIPVPVFSPLFVDGIKKFFTTSEQLRHNSAEYLQQAETRLLSALELEQWQPPEALAYERSSKDVLEAGRLDAEHYREQYYSLTQRLEDFDGQKTTTISELAEPLTNGVEIREYVESGTPYLRVADISNLGISHDKVVYVDKDAADAQISKVKLEAGDVLVSRSGSLAVIAVVEAEWQHALISSHLIRLRITDSDIDPYYLALYLSSMPGKQQIVQWSNGGVQPEISQPSLGRVVVAYPEMAVQKSIRAKIMEARNARQSSAQLLNAAKRAIEIAIEGSETQGLEFLSKYELKNAK